MARMTGAATRTADVAEEFLQGKFLQTMRLYAEMAGTENPATIAAARLQSGQAATIPGEWVSADWAGAIIQLKIGSPVVVVGTDG